MENHSWDKPTWVIEFSKEEIAGKPKISMRIPSEERKRDPKGLEAVNNNFNEFVNAINKLCSLLQKDCQEKMKEIEMAQEEAKSVDSSVANLREIVRKFIEMLKRFRKKDD